MRHRGTGGHGRPLAKALEHQRLRLDERTVLLIDEEGMADDQAMLKLLAAADVAGAKAVIVGDHHQLDAVEPGGGLEALIRRHGPAVHVLCENIRQRDRAERSALRQLRSGKVAAAVDWYRKNDRVRTASSRDEALDAAIDAGKPTCAQATKRSCSPGAAATSPPSTNAPASAGSNQAGSPGRRWKHSEASATPSAIAS